MNLLSKTGFYQTLRLLSSSNGKIELKSFYAQFIQDSYYNAFLRVKGELLANNLIEISSHDRTIELTKKGKRVWSLLSVVIVYINGSDTNNKLKKSKKFFNN